MTTTKREKEIAAHVARRFDPPELNVPDFDKWRAQQTNSDDPIDAYWRIEAGPAGTVEEWQEYLTLRFPNKQPEFYIHFAEQAAKQHAKDKDEEAAGDTEPLNETLEQPLLAKQPDILALFADDILKSGLVGEERLTKLIFLAIVTHHMPRLVSLAMKGPSASGKSFLTERALRYFPADAYFALTAMSDRALIYTDENFEHRFLVIYEATGMESDMTTYLIRTLLSEGHLRYMVTEKDPKTGKYKANMHEKPGPTGLIVTTTASTLHPENETRLLSLTVTDTNAQTKEILYSLAEQYDEPDYSEWHQLDRWIAQQDNRVVIPYATCFAAAMPPAAIRLRRDFGQVLALIRAHALLHQANRERDEDDKIVATQLDYEAVRDLVADIVAEAVEQSVPDTIRATVNAAKDIVAEHGLATIKDLMAVLKLDRSAVQRRVQGGVQAGFLKNLDGTSGRTAHYTLAQPLPDDIDVIPEWEAIIRPGCEGGVHLCNLIGGDIGEPPSDPSIERT